MTEGTVLRHITHKDLLVLVVRSNKSTVYCRVIPSFEEGLIFRGMQIELPNMGCYKWKHDFTLKDGRVQPVIQLKISRLNRSWKVDKVGTILYGRK